ncbi:chitinase, partial [Streptomyces sp. Ncost-T6T-2b]
MRRRNLSRMTIAGVALALLAGVAPAASAGTGHDRNGGGDRGDRGKGHHRPAYKNIGYFTQWGVYGRDFQVKDLDTSGAAARLTHINYAFGNVSAEGKCFTGNIPGQADAWADYARPLDAADSVDGVADTDTQPLAGNFNQLRELKAKHPAQGHDLAGRLELVHPLLRRGPHRGLPQGARRLLHRPVHQ